MQVVLQMADVKLPVQTSAVWPQPDELALISVDGHRRQLSERGVQRWGIFLR